MGGMKAETFDCSNTRSLNITPRLFSHLFQISAVPLSLAKIKELNDVLDFFTRDLDHIKI